MVRIPDLPDLSRFVQRTDKVPVYNTVHLLVGAESVEVSGPVVSQASQTLQDLVGNQPELYLDQFSGEIEGIRDVVELMYGGCVELSEVNYKTILKFSVVYQVKEMYKLSFNWVKNNILNLDLFELIQFGLLVDNLFELDATHVLDLCAGHIKDNVRDDLFEVSKSWVFADNIDFIKFLVQEEILYFTLPLLTSWTRNDADVNIILTELDSKELIQSLWGFGTRSSDFLDKMRDSCELPDTVKKIHTLQWGNYKACMKTCVDKSMSLAKVAKKCDIQRLLSVNYQLFKIDEILATEEEYNLTHPQYVEVVVHWIKNNQTSQNDLERLWGSFQGDLNMTYFDNYIRAALLPLKPTIQTLAPAQYKFYHYSKEVTKGSVTRPVKFEITCENCKSRHVFTMRLVDKTPCYELDSTDSDHNVNHVYLHLFDHGSYNDTFCSLVTNSYTSVLQKISEYRNNYFESLYSCNRISNYRAAPPFSTLP